jgi:hypothetical protein
VRDDRLPGPVEMLDEWDDDGPERPLRSRSWIAGLVALLVVGVVGVSVAVSETHPSAVEQVTPTLSSSAGQTPGDVGSTTPSPATTGTATASAGRVALQLPVLSSDDPAQPLRISLLDPAPVAPSAGLIAYRVQVCVSADSAGVASDTVRVTAGNWRLSSFPATANASPGVPAVAPQFPLEARLGKGQCVSGYVTFAWNVVEPADVLTYNDKRFGWYWRLT